MSQPSKTSEVAQPFARLAPESDSELGRLLSLVVRDEPLGDDCKLLAALETQLYRDTDGRVLSFLNRTLNQLEGQGRGSIALLLSRHYYQELHDLPNLQRLFAIDDPAVKEGVLHGLIPTRGAIPEMGPGVVALALKALHHSSASVRVKGCHLVMQQGGWNVDVSTACEPIRSLLSDEHPRVRQQVAYTVGNLGQRYDMSGCVGLLGRNLSDEDLDVRDACAWALWKLSRYPHDIGAVVPELVAHLANAEYDFYCKHPAGALLHHARKSAKNRAEVRRSVKAANMKGTNKVTTRFLQDLADL